MNTALTEKIVSWLEQTFSQVGEFCEMTLELDPESMQASRDPWPSEALELGHSIGAVEQVRGGDPPQAFGIVFDRGLAIHLACKLLMLLPSAIEEKLQTTEGELDEDSFEGFTELGNVVTGVINQLAHEEADDAHQIEFVGLHAPGHPPSNDNFPEDLFSFAVKVKAGAESYQATLYLSDEVITNWLGPLLKEEEEEESEQEEAGGGSKDAGDALPEFEINEGGRKPWLVVDNIIEDSSMLAGLLAEDSVQALSATTRARAIELMKTYLIEGMFIDFGLPDNGGLAFLKQLRQNFLTDDLPIIMTSSAVTREQVMEAVRNGATHIVVKPITHESLNGAFKKALNRHPRYRAAVYAAREKEKGEEQAPDASQDDADGEPDSASDQAA